MCKKLKEIFENIEKSGDQSNLKSEDEDENEEETRNQYEGLFDTFDVDSVRLGKTVKERGERLLELMRGVDEMTLGYQGNSIDAFGDAYEYLWSMYAANAGKSGGEFFTPQEVAKLLAKLALFGKTEIESVYDPACGSGSLLLQAAKLLGKGKVKKFVGKEINLTSYNLCRINMLLHDIDYDKFDIAYGDVLTQTKHRNEEKEPEYDEMDPFEAIVSKPPSTPTYGRLWRISRSSFRRS